MKNKGKLLKKRILSFLLAAAMLYGILPANAIVANATSTSAAGKFNRFYFRFFLA